MELKNIKLGADYKATREAVKKSENLIITPFPSFCNSKYQIAENLDTKEEMYLLVKNGIIVDITTDDSKAYNYDEAERTLDFILGNV